uniref:Spliceosome associated protein n=1 Tax=Solanum tuberosum TaxID=4113 RepID=M1E0L2_SOLTU
MGACLSNKFSSQCLCPKDRVTNAHQGYSFVEFQSEEGVDYAIKVLNMIELYGEPTVPSVLEANGAVGAPIPPLPFANGPMPPIPVPAIQPPPMHPNVYPPMQMPSPQACQGQPMQPAAGGIL